jgi:hypothetical protein
MCSLYSRAVTDDVYLHHHLQDNAARFKIECFISGDVDNSNLPTDNKGISIFHDTLFFFSILLHALDCTLLTHRTYFG